MEKMNVQIRKVFPKIPPRTLKKKKKKSPVLPFVTSWTIIPQQRNEVENLGAQDKKLPDQLVDAVQSTE